MLQVYVDRLSVGDCESANAISKETKDPSVVHLPRTAAQPHSADRSKHPASAPPGPPYGDSRLRNCLRLWKDPAATAKHVQVRERLQLLFACDTIWYRRWIFRNMTEVEKRLRERRSLHVIERTYYNGVPESFRFAEESSGSCTVS